MTNREPWRVSTKNGLDSRASFKNLIADRLLGEVYNQKRLHSSIGYLPPVEFEQLVNLNHADQPDLFIR